MVRGIVRKMWVLVLMTAGVPALAQWTPLPVADDPLLRLPGSQPGQVTLESGNNCLNCHDGFDAEVEPGHGWRGSMMAQAMRDPLFWACLTVAAQDSIWAIGRPNATDLCMRCHTPRGWLEGRSDPTNGSLFTGEDFDGVDCVFCHTTIDPFFEDTHAGTREGSDWLHDWDETNQSGTPSQPAADQTRAQDQADARNMLLFNGDPFYVNDRPFSALYDENGLGQYFVSAVKNKRGSFADAGAKHSMLYSRYHKSRYFCGTCHDVSNPVLHNLAFEGTLPGDGQTILPSEKDPAWSYFHVERTFSEFMLSAFGQPGGATGRGPFAPSRFETSLPGNAIAHCQDCHMPDREGKAANKSSAVERPEDSVEHPMSGVPNHQMMGGNVFFTQLLASTVPGSPNHDPVNEQLLDQGPGVLTLDLTQGLGLDPVALLDAARSAERMLQDAAAIRQLSFDGGTRTLSFRVRNRTGHKLTSGFPEGRRIFATVRAFLGGRLVWAVNQYDPQTGTFHALAGEPVQPGRPSLHQYDDTLVYEVVPSSTLTGEEHTFHFVLADGRHKDNRIPPRGFDIGGAAARQCEPVWDGVPRPDLYTAEEYAGGYDQVELAVPVNCDRIRVDLYYQTTSKEYVEFLRDEINGVSSTLPPSAYVIQGDPWFDRLKAWGDTIWNLWDHNRDLPGAAPIRMAMGSIRVPTEAPTGLGR